MNDDYYLGRSCPTEPQTDPLTGAKLCELPNMAETTQNAPDAPQTRQIPQVGGELGIIVPVLLSLAVVVIFKKSRRK